MQRYDNRTVFLRQHSEVSRVVRWLQRNLAGCLAAFLRSICKTIAELTCERLAKSRTFLGQTPHNIYVYCTIIIQLPSTFYLWYLRFRQQSGSGCDWPLSWNRATTKIVCMMWTSESYYTCIETYVRWDSSTVINDYLSPHVSLLDIAAATAPPIAAKTPGIPCKLCTPQVSCNLSFDDMAG